MYYGDTYQLQFKNLLKVEKLVLALPHSNRGKERVFSMVRKNKTTFRASMGFNTLGSLLSVKLDNPNTVSFKPDQELQKSAKKAAIKCNKEHSLSTSSSKSGQV